MPGQRENVGGLEIDSAIDLAGLEKGMDAVFAKLKALDPALQNTEKGMGKMEQAGKGAAAGFNLAKIGSEALSVGLGVLGVQSISAVVFKIINLTRECVNLAVNLDAIASQARTVFGEAFPQMEAAAESLAQQFNRSSSDILHWMGGFGDFLDQLGFGPAQTVKMSKALAEMTIEFGKLKPNIPDEEIFNALQAGLAGNYKALRSLDVLVKEDTLQQYANGLALKNQVKDMDDQQKAMLVTMFLQAEMKKKTDELAKANGSLGDNLKSAGSEWQDLKEEFGKGIGPIVAEGFRELTEMLKSAREGIEALGKAWAWLKGLFASGPPGLPPANAQTGQGMLLGQKSLMPQGVAPQKEWTGSVGHFGTPPKDQAALDILNRTPHGGGGGADAADKRKKQEEDLKKVEQDILDTYSKQNAARLDMVKDERESLMLKKEMGVITKDEERRLETINRRMAFKNDLLDEAVRSWHDEVDALKEVEDKIKSINEKIVEAQKDLEDKIAKIKDDAKEQEISRAEDLVRQINEIRSHSSDLNQTGGLSSDESFKVGELSTQLNSFSADVQAEGSRRAGLTDEQKIKEETDRKIAAAKAESAEKIKGLQEELAQEQKNKDQVVALEAQKRQAVLSALAERQVSTKATYDQIDKDTKAHVDTQIAEFNRLQSALRATAPVGKGFAAGGVITGPGGPTDDRVPIWASPGERITNAAASKRFGPLLDAINGFGANIPRFAQGGVVNDNHSRIVNQTNHWHGSAPQHQNQVAARWQARRIIL